MLDKSELQNLYQLQREYSTDAVLILEEGVFIDCNAYALDLFKYKKLKELINLHPSALSPKLQPDGQDSLSKADEMINTCLDIGYHRFEWMYKTKKDKPIWTEVTLTKLTNKPPFKIHVTLRNIHKEKKLTSQLHTEIKQNRRLISTLEEYKLIIDKMVIVSKTDAMGVITYVNDHFINLSGYSEEELVGHSHNIIRHPDTPVAVFKEMWDTIIKNKVWQGTLKNRAKDGSTYYVKASIVPLLDEEQNILEYIGLREDITDIMEANIRIEKEKRKAQEAEKAKAFFLASMSHEIRTPMNGIVGFTKLLSDSELNPEQKKYTALIESSTKTLTSIVNDVLDYSKIENGKMVLDPVEVNPFLELDSLFAQFEVMAIEKEIKLCMHIDARICEIIKLDSLRLTQVLSNLLSNALKFTYREGSIHIHISCLKDRDTSQHLLFEIVDTGIGMDIEQQKKIFTAFEQADNSTTRKFGGTGLGLSISSSLIKLMNSSLELKSEPNKGSTFSFSLDVPVCTKKPLLKAILKKKRIALIYCEDNNEYLLVKDQLDYLSIPYDILYETALDYDIYICFDIFDSQKLLEYINTDQQDIILIYPIGNVIEDVHILTHYTQTPASLYRLLYTLENKKSSKQVKEDVNIKLLIAEDYELNRVLLTEMLGKYHINPDFAVNGQEAVEMARSEKYDLILMDINMPIINGMDATKIIRIKDKEVPIVALSANVMLEDRQNYLDAGMNDFLSKPIERDKLFKTIQEYKKGITPLEEPTNEDFSCCILDAVESLGLPEETIQRLVKKFTQDSKISLETLFDNEPSHEEIALCFHTLKGTAGTLRLTTIADISKEVEHAAKESQDIDYQKKRDEVLALFSECEKYYLEEELKT